MTAQQDDRTPLSREAQPLADLSTKREGIAMVDAVRKQMPDDGSANFGAGWIAACDAFAALASQAPAQVSGLPPIDESLHSPEVVESLQHSALVAEPAKAHPQPVDASGKAFEREQVYLSLVEGWIRDNRVIVFTDGSVDDLCDRIAAALSRAQAFPAREGIDREAQIERVAVAIFIAKNGKQAKWATFPKVYQDGYRGLGAAAIDAMIPAAPSPVIAEPGE